MLPEHLPASFSESLVEPSTLPEPPVQGVSVPGVSVENERTMSPPSEPEGMTAADSAEPPRINLKNHTLDELQAALQPLGVPEKQVRQLMARVLGRELPLEGLKGLSKVRQALLEQRTVIPRLELVEKVVSSVDGFTKFLFKTHDGHFVEAVRIPLLAHRFSVCISSQVGCALGCTFCATGKLGFRRNLEAWEMVDQVLQVREGAERPVTGVVFMGQGEPFLNYDNVLKAAAIMKSPTGLSIAAEAITISTAGILPRIRQYTEEGHPYRLIVSLSAGTSETRRKIMPIEKKYPLDELIPAIGEYARSRRTRATIAWVAMKGINTTAAELQALKARLGDIPIRFNLIEVNDPEGQFVAPVGEDFRAFVDELQQLQVPIARRYTGGKDIEAACGRLASTRQSPLEAELSV